jgi:carbamoyltransferase
VSNGRLLREGPFENLWIQPAAGDAGGAIGGALYAWHQLEGGAREPDGVHDTMKGAYLGPRFSPDEIVRYLDDSGYPYERLPDSASRAKRIAELVADGKVIGLLTGRMEFGPRALGHRSIIGDPRSPKMQSTMNLKIKHRESFRPFAPAVLEERVSDWFAIDVASPYMMITADVTEEHREPPPSEHSGDLRDWVNEVRSDIPAVTHVDYSARLQTVNREQSPEFHEILSAFEDLTGCPVLINTSFNVRGEPIVCTPEDAYRCFMRTEIDHLVLEDCILDKVAQPDWAEEDDWQETFVLD